MIARQLVAGVATLMVSWAFLWLIVTACGALADVLPASSDAVTVSVALVLGLMVVGAVYLLANYLGVPLWQWAAG